MKDNARPIEIKSTALTYLFWLTGGLHYAYLGKWRLQIFFWLSLGGLGVWALIDLFKIPDMVDEYNYRIYKNDATKG